MVPMAGSTKNQNEHYNGILEFKAGVTACLRSWSALRTAVESGWGGGERESHKKADVLRHHIFEKMDGSKCPLPNYEAFDLADDLAIYIEEEFSVTLEDNSERQLADAIFKMYECCLNGDPRLARQMITQAAGALELIGQFPVTVQTTEHDDDDEEMVATESPTIGETMGISRHQLQQNQVGVPNLVEYVDQPLFGKERRQQVFSAGPARQLGESAPDRDVVEMDEDGFAPVKKWNRRR